jgi:GNAT superfamily N-acetyltransferase
MTQMKSDGASCGDIQFSTDKQLLNTDLIIEYLQETSYWAKDRTTEAILKSIDHSICFGAYLDQQQIGFGRAVTDRAVFFYLADIFILPDFQGKGIGQRFMKFILQHEDLQNMRAVLTTQTAHSFYEKFGFTTNSVIIKERMMVIANHAMPRSDAKDH